MGLVQWAFRANHPRIKTKVTTRSLLLPTVCADEECEALFGAAGSGIADFRKSGGDKLGGQKLWYAARGTRYSCKLGP